MAKIFVFDLATSTTPSYNLPQNGHTIVKRIYTVRTDLSRKKFPDINSGFTNTENIQCMFPATPLRYPKTTSYCPRGSKSLLRRGWGGRGGERVQRIEDLMVSTRSHKSLTNNLGVVKRPSPFTNYDTNSNQWPLSKNRFWKKEATGKECFPDHWNRVTITIDVAPRKGGTNLWVIDK